MRRKQINKPIIPIQPTAYDEKEMAEMADYVPEIVVMSHPRDSSMDTIDTTSSTQGRKLSLGQDIEDLQDDLALEKNSNEENHFSLEVKREAGIKEINKKDRRDGKQAQLH
ncbi:hypothetical protein Mgra_00008806 [Meloidogyne graminicola]|uniref:Uncharacterized protein n=1 Tax=Meloidogyne graminicola TaxID=189291 RepID=A0A8S9ZES0_9BILA|nr:hypothetical protein Mgra_00008806 [Meloidogyne graminicola]